MIDEATFDWNKFKDNGKPSTAKHQPAAQGTEHDPPDKRSFMMSKDFEEKPEPQQAAGPEGHPADFHHLAPIPTEAGAADGKRLDRAKFTGGFGKMTNWVVSGKHWGKATQGEKDAVNLEGPDFVKPKTDDARQVVRILNLDKLRMTDMVKPEVWKKHFEHKFGPQGK